MFSLASWNVNSLRVRETHVLRFVDRFEPDILCLQETRVTDAKFPRAAFASRGYAVVTAASAGYAGVAIASRLGIDEHHVGLAEFVPHRPAGRRLVCRVGDVWIDTVYVPTRRAIGKVTFLEALRIDHLARFGKHARAVLAGDFNICFDDRDCASRTQLVDGDVFPMRPEDLAFRHLVGDASWIDCLRVVNPDAGHFSWFPNATWARSKNWGMRLDYVFATPPLAAHVVDVEQPVGLRDAEGASDHVPVIVRFDA